MFRLPGEPSSKPADAHLVYQNGIRLANRAGWKVFDKKDTDLARILTIEAS